MKKKIVGIMLLLCLVTVAVSGCIDNDTSDVQVISGKLTSVESVDGYLVVHFENDGYGRFYYSSRSGKDKADDYISIHSYIGHTVSIFYYNGYWDDGDDKFFHLTLK